jgi:uncharacterized protein (DUF362 family)
MSHGLTRREFFEGALGGILAAYGASFARCTRKDWRADTFIGKVANYESDITSVILSGLKELQVGPKEIRGKRILLKPNLIEPHVGAGHINTNPKVVRAAIEGFLHCGASKVLVAEGPGHCRDSMRVLEESGLGDVLLEDRIPFVDLNYEQGVLVRNLGGRTRLPNITLPLMLQQVDWIVSVAKMKTHHWAGVTLSMKNLFGLMPGIYYGFPKNVFHWEGIDNSIFDINATVRPHFAIIDGIVGMEGDGPIMGPPKRAGVLIMGQNPTAVDATSSRIMGIDPYKVLHLKAASNLLGPINESHITQKGEKITSVRTDFVLLDKIHAQQGLRLT